VGTAPEGRYCDILNKAIIENRVPPQWSPGTNDLHDRYHCSEFITGATPDYPEQWHAPLCFSQDGTIVHKVGCPMAYGGKPWQWSTDQPMGNVRIVAGQAGWLACGHCKPFA
jgi:hypothetical protein